MKVYELLADPANWIKGAYARDIGYNVVPLNDPNACRWCLAGAIRKCYGEKWTIPADKLFYKLSGSYVEYNDSPSTTHEDIIGLCRELDI